LRFSGVTAMQQIQATIAAAEAVLKDAADANPVFLTTAEKREALLAAMRLQAEIGELTLRLMAAAGDVAEEVGCRDVGTWLVAQELVDARPARAQLRLAQALEKRPGVRAGLAEGRFGVEHAQVITRALDHLDNLDDLAGGPDWLPAAVLEKAEAHLCDLATRHRPGDLRRLATHLLEVVAPELAEQADAKALARLEATAHAKATLSITSWGHGMGRILALAPEAVCERLRTLVESFAQPRIAALEADGRIRPRNRILAEAFAQLLESIDTNKLPAHGGDSTTVVVTITLDHLRNEFGTAELAGAPISAGEARRLACTAGIIPVVLGGSSEPLDLGRTRRLFTGAQRKAMRLRDRHCRAEGCTVPAIWCDAHHDDPWSRGGRTDLARGSLLCGHHHRLVHNPAYETSRLPNGDYRFHRRT
jgi:hypothetical protein